MCGELRTRRDGAAWCLAVLAGMLGWVLGGEPPSGITKLSLPTNSVIERADFFYWSPGGELNAALILCPGKNGNGEQWIKEEKWQKFARDRRLLLCGIWFVSKESYPEPCYSDARNGSDKLVLNAVRLAGAEKLPLLLYGFSAGARFTASFVEQHPGRVLAWCACGVGLWVPVSKKSQPPPGIVASGEYDSGSFDASLQYFQRGRELGRKWTWLSAPQTAHHRSAALEDFLRNYFSGRLDAAAKTRASSSGEWLDIETKKTVTSAELRDYPIFAAWLPDADLAKKWQQLHCP